MVSVPMEPPHHHHAPHHHQSEQATLYQAKEIEEWIINTRRLLHQNPELSFQVRMAWHGVAHHGMGLGCMHAHVRGAAVVYQWDACPRIHPVPMVHSLYTHACMHA